MQSRGRQKLVEICIWSVAHQTNNKWTVMIDWLIDWLMIHCNRILRVHSRCARIVGRWYGWYPQFVERTAVSSELRVRSIICHHSRKDISIYRPRCQCRPHYRDIKRRPIFKHVSKLSTSTSFFSVDPSYSHSSVLCMKSISVGQCHVKHRNKVM